MDIINRILNHPVYIFKGMLFFFALLALLGGVYDLVRYLRKEDISDYERQRSWFAKVVFGNVDPQLVLRVSSITSFGLALVLVLVAIFIRL